MRIIVEKLRDEPDVEIRAIRAKDALTACDTVLKNIGQARSFNGQGASLNIFRRHTTDEVKSMQANLRYNDNKRGNKPWNNGKKFNGKGNGGGNQESQ